VTLLALKIYKHRVVRYMFFLIVVLTWIDVSNSKEIQYTGTFSSLQYYRESGDLGGTELRIVLTRSGYQSTILRWGQAPVIRYRHNIC
jgi:hypothetical protein